MNFSIEELYFMYGQYEAFVSVQFHPGSKTHQIFNGDSLMGWFKFTLHEKRKYEALRDSKNIPRSDSFVKFVPSSGTEYSNDIRTFLDRDGFLCSDIMVVYSSIRKRENRFIVQGKKEIPDKIIITSNEENEWEAELLTIGLYKDRLRRGGKLLPFEYDKLWGLQLFYSYNEVKDTPELYEDEIRTRIRTAVRLHYLSCKSLHEKASEEEENERHELLKEEFNRKEAILVREIRKNGLQINRLKDLEEGDIYKAIAFMAYYDDELILPYDHPIWCDFERLAHIYIGHVKEFYIGKPDNRSFFQYNIPEVKNIICNVIEDIYKEYLDAVTKNPNGGTWGRRGPRAIEYDGNYYRVEIQPNGRLITFHPYSNFEETQINS